MAAFDRVSDARRKQHETVRAECDALAALRHECAVAFHAVVEAGRCAGVEAGAPSVTNVAEGEICHADVQGGKKAFEDRKLEDNGASHWTDSNQIETNWNGHLSTISMQAIDYRRNPCSI